MRTEIFRLKKQLHQLETRPVERQTSKPVTYASIAGKNVPPGPKPIATVAQVNMKQVKPLKSEYRRAAGEIVVSFANAPLNDTSNTAADGALNVVNYAMNLSPLRKQIFFGARFSITDNLVLTTALHSTHDGLEDYSTTIEKAVSYIGPATAKCSAVWSKFLLHGVPTHMSLDSIRSQVEGFTSGLRLGQTPPEARQTKSHSTTVHAFAGDVNLKQLGGRSLLVGNRACNLTLYTPFGPQTQCTHCQAFGHPKEFCTASARYAVCALEHETSQHPCHDPNCKKGIRCTHGTIKCHNCSNPHTATDQQCPARPKVSQEFRLFCRTRKGLVAP
jgi:hypothetical protein